MKATIIAVAAVLALSLMPIGAEAQRGGSSKVAEDIHSLAALTPHGVINQERTGSGIWSLTVPKGSSPVHAKSIDWGKEIARFEERTGLEVRAMLPIPCSGTPALHINCAVVLKTNVIKAVVPFKPSR